MSASSPSASHLALRVLLPFAAGYFLSYLYRTVNAVLAPEIVRSIHLDAADLGLMTGAYFLAFAAAQLPLGMALDRFGPRRIESALLVFAAAGALAFSWAEGAGTLVAGRALIGFGVAACLMAALKANVQWYPARKLALVNGIVLSAGGLGAVAATAPVQALLAVTDWRGIYALLAILTLVAAVGLFVTVPEHETHSGGIGLAGQLREVGRVVASPLFLRVAPVTTIAMGSFMAVQGLWAGPWLRDVAGLSPEATATGLTVMAAAMAAGFLAMGAIADRLARRGVPTVRVAAIGLGAYWLSSLAMALGFSGSPMLLAAVYGFSGAAATLNYSVLTQGYPAHLAGRVNTSVNLAIFVAAFATQWGLGAVIGLWEQADGSWPVEAHRAALVIPVALNLAAFLWFIPVARTSPTR